MSSTALRRATCAIASVLFVAVGCAEPAAPIGDVPGANAVPTGRDAAASEVVTPVDGGPEVGADVTRTADTPDAADAPPLAPCAFGAPCPAGSQCYTTGCVPAIPAGGRCEPRDLTAHPCAFGNDCAPDASGVDHCTPAGAEGSYCNRSTVAPPVNDCDPGLACHLDPSGYYRCRPGLRVGELCADALDPCPTVGSCCGASTSCLPVNGTARCVVTPADGAIRGACGVGCDAGATCVTTGATARCVAAGAAGGRCRATAPACDDGAQCDTPLGAGVCRRRLARGEACEASAATAVCADGLACTTADSTEAGECAPPGAVAGADCRAAEPSCDGALRCSNFSRYRSTCRVIARVGDACDLGGVRTLCPDGTRCVPATGLRGDVAIATCTPSTPEAEPNDAPDAPGAAVARSVLYRGALSPTDARDCFAVTATAGASLYVETVPSRLTVSLFDPAGAEVGRWVSRGGFGPLADTARLRPEELGVLRGLRAGTHVVCVSSPALPVATYTLALGVLPPGP
jgi:hypothetical protein